MQLTRRANGDAQPYFDRSKNRWYVQLEVGRSLDGRRIRKKVSGKTKSETRLVAREARQAMEVGLPVPDRTRTVAHFLAWWSKEILPGSVSDGTEETYLRALRLYVAPALGHLRLRDLAPADVTMMLRGMEVRGLSVSTQSLARRVLARALRRAEQEGWVVRNAARIADGPRGGAAKETRSLSIGEAQEFLEALVNEDIYAAVITQLVLGLRRGEVLGLSWQDVEISSTPTLTVRQQLQRRSGRGLVLTPTKTKKSARRLSMPSVVAEALRAKRVQQAEWRLAAGELWANKNDLVFTTELGTPVDPDNYRHRVAKSADASGIGGIGTHVLRHSAGSIMFALGIPTKTISEVLGHSTTRITEDVYLHVHDATRLEVAVTLDAVNWIPAAAEQ